MGYGSFLSVLLHVCIFALAVLGLPRLFDPEPVEMGAVAVEIASLSELEAAAPPARPEPAAPVAEPPPAAKAAPPEAPPLPPSPEPALTIPEPRPVPPEAAPAPAAVPKPKAKPLAPEPDPAPPPKPKAKPSPPPPPKAVKKVAAKKPPKPRRKPRPPDRMGTVLKNLDRIAAPVPKPKPKPARNEEKAVAAAKPSLQERFRQQRRGDESVIIAQLRRQLEPCWSVPAGGKDVAGIKVPIRIRLQPDGSLAGRPVVESAARLASDQMYRTVAESALRALRDPRCVPFNLPYGQYDIWKDVVFSFDPKEMLGE